MRTCRAEAGLATPATVAAAAIALWLFAVLANLVVVHYATGVIRGALDEGVRAGASAGAGPAECQARIEQVLGDLMGGPYGARVEVTCAMNERWVAAEAGGFLPGLVPPVPDFAVSYRATATREQA